MPRRMWFGPLAEQRYLEIAKQSQRKQLRWFLASALVGGITGAVTSALIIALT